MLPVIINNWNSGLAEENQIIIISKNNLEIPTNNYNFFLPLNLGEFSLLAMKVHPKYLYKL